MLKVNDAREGSFAVKIERGAPGGISEIQAQHVIDEENPMKVKPAG